MFASRLAWLAWAAVGMVFVSSLALPTPTLPGNHSWLRRFQTPELSYGITLAQTFRMNRDWLRAVEFYPAANGLPLSGNVGLALIDTTVTDAATAVVRGATVRAADLVRGSSYRFEFRPIADSTSRTYRFEVTATDSSSGVVLWATKGDPYEAGTLLANGRSRWADLTFEAVGPTSRVGRALWTKLAPESGWRSGRVVLALFAVSWIALGALFRALLSLPANAEP